METAKSYGQRSFEMAEKINDDNWRRNSTILIAQSEAKIGDEQNLKLAIGNFERALEYTEKEGDTGATKAIKIALADCQERLKKLQINTPRADSDKKGNTSSTNTSNQSPTTKPKEEKAPESPPLSKAAQLPASTPAPAPAPAPAAVQKTEEKKTNLPIDYEIHIKTSDDMDSGTDAKVFISLFGDAGDLIDLGLRNDTQDLFERKRMDTFVFKKLSDVGKVSNYFYFYLIKEYFLSFFVRFKLKKIKIGHDGIKSSSTWKLEYVKVYYNNTVYT